MSYTPSRKISYTKPSITELEVRLATDAAANGWGQHCYDYIARFEEAFKNHLGVKYAIATSSCTGALHMGMSALGISQDDEVILADTNWIATVSPVVHLGAKPVFVDILPDSWCLDPLKVELAITPRTKAIIAVHLYGNLCAMEALLEIGQRYGIPVIEDAAEAIGSIYYGKHAGSMGIFGAFSFHGTKTITTGEGGMFVTNNPDLFERVLTLSNHGRSKDQSKQFWPDIVGFKFKMSNIQAALGCAQLQRIDELILAKRKIASKYFQVLDSFSLPFVFNPEPENCSNGYWMPTFIDWSSSNFNRDKLANYLTQKGIDARVIFWPLSSTIANKDQVQYCNEYSSKIHLRGLNLPSPYDILDEEIEYICKNIYAYYQQIS